jgi:hypothetical protein
LDYSLRHCGRRLPERNPCLPESQCCGAPERRAITKRLSKADAEDAANTMAAAIRDAINPKEQAADFEDR